MSLKAQPWPDLPSDTARVARAAFRRGSLYLTLGDKVGQLFGDADLADLYALEGSPGYSPAQLTMVLIFQAMENLSDRDAAEAVRARIDWKYALHLRLDDTGFDYSVLSEFRERLIRHEAGARLLNIVLERLETLGLVKPGRQRTDATYVVSAARLLNRLELLVETMRMTLETLAVDYPDWLRRIALGHWVERYALGWRGVRLPRSQAEREKLGDAVGQDGFYLLEQAQGAGAPEGLAEHGSLTLLAQVWRQQYEQGPEGPRLRPGGSLPAGDELINTPHDPEARYSEHGSHTWVGYKVHLTETCGEDAPRLITHVEVTRATQPDVATLDDVHQALQQEERLPSEHLVDRGYMAGHTLRESQAYGVDLIGMVLDDTSWQAQGGGFTTAAFRLDWEHKHAECPEGQTATTWSESHDDFGRPVIHVRFDKHRCQRCASRAQCTRSAQGRSLKLSRDHQTILQARERQATSEFRYIYAKRSGIEGTISCATQAHGARQSRYIGLAKTWLQQLMVAIAIDLQRAAAWLDGWRPATTRLSHLKTVLAAA